MDDPSTSFSNFELIIDVIFTTVAPNSLHYENEPRVLTADHYRTLILHSSTEAEAIPVVQKKSTFQARGMMCIQRMMICVLIILGVMLIVENHRHPVFTGMTLFADAFSTTSINLQKSPTWERRRKLKETGQQESKVGPVVVIGKIIIDEYRSPLDEEDGKKETREDAKITIGGGGPQAAWGAAAALAVMELMENSSSDAKGIDEKTLPQVIPPKQSVVFLGPVGNANGIVPDIQDGLNEILGPAVDTIKLVVEPSLQTPTIQLWHDEQQDIQWKPLNDCWGSKGADSLWRNRPSAEDILQLECLQRKMDGETALPNGEQGDSTTAEAFVSDQPQKNKISNLHVIMEMGVSAAGGGQDSEFLFNAELMRRVSHVCIEPVAFPEEVTVEDGINQIGSTAIPQQDVVSSQQRLQPHSSKINVIVPDSHLVDAWIKCGYIQELCESSDMVGRFGPSGSRVYRTAGPGLSSSTEVDYLIIPAATLETPNGKPVNPTGAGNAYSAALSTCRSRGWSIEESACLATAVGACFCEYEHLPPWTWSALDRIKRGTLEVYDAIATKSMIED